MELLLLGLAEAYLGAAYGTSPSLQPGGHVGPVDFHRLIATALGCLEVAFKEWRLLPHIEAAARFRYASVLFHETENYIEAEETLSRGISLCDRHRLLDAKYNMQHLLSRLTFETNPRAALKYLDGVLKDVEAYHHVAWVYAFRFLRASLSLQMLQSQETLIAINQLRMAAGLASSRGDHAISATASAMESLVHVSRSNATESIEQAQRALAAARRSQLDPAAQAVPQLTLMTHVVDLCCSLYQGDTAQATAKMHALHALVDSLSDNQGWSYSKVFYVPIQPAAMQAMQSQGFSDSVIRNSQQGNPSLCVSWLTKDEISILGYLLSAAVVHHKNAMDGQKAERYLKEAQHMLSTKPETGYPDADDRQRLMQFQVKTQLIFALGSRAAWGVARKELFELEALSATLPDSFAPTTAVLIHYIRGLIFQGTGDIAAALAAFQSPPLALPSPGEAVAPLRRDLAILSALNSLLIIRQPDHPKHALFTPVLSALEPLALSHPSRNIYAAYKLIQAVSPSTAEASIVKTKQYLQSALQAAKQTSNNQLMCITLNFMSWKFFRGVVGEQAEKSASASQTLARKGKDSLWLSVADGMLADTLETQGKEAEGEVARREGTEIASHLPSVMQRDAALVKVKTGDYM